MEIFGLHITVGMEYTAGVQKTGKIIDRIKLPARDITSCCFGGENLNYLLLLATQSLSKRI